jgi:hypothetical protein
MKLDEFTSLKTILLFFLGEPVPYSVSTGTLHYMWVGHCAVKDALQTLVDRTPGDLGFVVRHEYSDVPFLYAEPSGMFPLVTVVCCPETRHMARIDHFILPAGMR